MFYTFFAIAKKARRKAIDHGSPKGEAWLPFKNVCKKNEAISQIWGEPCLGSSWTGPRLPFFTTNEPPLLIEITRGGFSNTSTFGYQTTSSKQNMREPGGRSCCIGTAGFTAGRQIAVRAKGCVTPQMFADKICQCSLIEMNDTSFDTAMLQFAPWMIHVFLRTSSVDPRNGSDCNGLQQNSWRRRCRAYVMDQWINGSPFVDSRPYQPPAGSAGSKPPPTSYNPMQVPGTPMVWIQNALFRILVCGDLWWFDLGFSDDVWWCVPSTEDCLNRWPSDRPVHTCTWWSRSTSTSSLRTWWQSSWRTLQRRNHTLMRVLHVCLV